MPDLEQTALVVEGGGLRGVFASGVLDAFLDANFDPFGLYLGVSSGAINLSSYLASQRGQGRDYYLRYATDERFINLGRFLRGGHWMDLDWFWQESMLNLPFDLDAALSKLRARRFVMVATSLSAGKPLYLEPERGTWLACLQASSAVPFMYRRAPLLGGEPTTDGGVSDPLPVEEAYRRGARRIVVLRSRLLSCVKGSLLEALAVRYALRRYPAARQLALRQQALYSAALGFMAEPPADAEVWQIAPAQLHTKRAQADPATLRTDYEHGYAAGQHFVEHTWH